MQFGLPFLKNLIQDGFCHRPALEVRFKSKFKEKFLL